MEKPEITAEKVVTVLDQRFVKVYDIQYREGKHYYDASRRPKEALMCLADAQTYSQQLPDAVSCVVILEVPGEEPKLLLQNEFRYPAGQFLLSVPAGLIDPEDKKRPIPEVFYATASREMKEETGLTLTEKDTLRVINPFLFSTPGMTDESNALVEVVIRSFDPKELSQDGAEGSECFDGFVMLTKADAKRIFRQGMDDQGIFYSVYTWAALSYFIGEMWKD